MKTINCMIASIATIIVHKAFVLGILTSLFRGYADFNLDKDCTIDKNDKKEYGMEWLDKNAASRHTVFLTNLTYKYISSIHDVALFTRVKGVYCMVVEMPMYSTEKMEISTMLMLNPIIGLEESEKSTYMTDEQLDKGLSWNYGALPQTWQSANSVDPWTNIAGNNSQLKVIEIGENMFEIGMVIHVKILGAYPMVDSTGKMDWKIIAIAANDLNASMVHNVEDAQKYFPRLMEEIRAWLVTYNVKIGMSENKFCETIYKRRSLRVRDVVNAKHKLWKEAVKKSKVIVEGWNFTNTQLKNYVTTVTQDKARNIVDGVFDLFMSPFIIDDKHTMDMSNREYHTECIDSAEQFTRYVMFLKNDMDEYVSTLHDVALYTGVNGVYRMVVVMPKNSTVRMEISTTLKLNPIVSVDESEKSTYMTDELLSDGFPWNYGALPQTWQRRRILDPWNNVAGNNSHIKVLEIGENEWKRGEVIYVKILAAYLMIGSTNTTEWKMIAIAVNDPMANRIRNIDDAKEYFPRLMEGIRKWLLTYDVKRGVWVNVFWEMLPLMGYETQSVVNQKHDIWKNAVGRSEIIVEGLNFTNTQLENSVTSVDKKNAFSIVDGIYQSFVKRTTNTVGYTLDEKLTVDVEDKTVYKAELLSSRNTNDFVLFLKRCTSKTRCDFVSTIHDVPLFTDTTGVYRVVVEIPLGTTEKMEICTERSLNPIVYTVNGELDVDCDLLLDGLPWNYGALPQTWQSPTIVDLWTSDAGNNGPLKVLVVGSSEYEYAEVVKVRVLGAVPMIDSAGKTDWKMIAVATSDLKTAKVEDVEDLAAHFPGILEKIKQWLITFNVKRRMPWNQFWNDGTVLDRYFARDVVDEKHRLWKNAVERSEVIVEGFNFTNTKLKNTKTTLRSFMPYGFGKGYLRSLEPYKGSP